MSDTPKTQAVAPIALGDLIETATTSVSRAMDARALNPQPLPPGENPLMQHRIIIGIIFDPQGLPQATPLAAPTPAPLNQ